MAPIVSIITPCYGHAQYLAETLRSALNQTFPDWELIAVDDSSPDDSAHVIQSFGDPRIHYIHQANEGMAGARNTGLRQAQGEFVVFLDDDDLLEPEFLQTCLDAVRRDPTLAGVYVWNYHVDGHGARLPMINGYVIPREQFHRRLLEGGFFPPVAALTRLAIVREVGLFDATLEGEADRDLWLRISARADMLGIPRPLVSYRMHVGGRSNDMDHMFSDCLRVLNKHLGPPTGNPQTWSEDKRLAYGFAHRYAAFGFFQQGQTSVAWKHLEEATRYYPPILTRLDTFYELACGDQRKGVRGKADLIDLPTAGTQMIQWLDRWYAQPDHTVAPYRRTAYGNAYLALAMLSDQAGDWAAARRYLLRGIQANPTLLTSHATTRRLTKLLVGKRVAAALKPQSTAQDHVR